MIHNLYELPSNKVNCNQKCFRAVNDFSLLYSLFLNLKKKLNLLGTTFNSYTV